MNKTDMTIESLIADYPYHFKMVNDDRWRQVRDTIIEDVGEEQESYTATESGRVSHSSNAKWAMYLGTPTVWYFFKSDNNAVKYLLMF